MKTKIEKLVLAIVVFMLTFSHSMTVFGADQIDIHQDVNLTLSYRHEETIVSDAEFRLYRIANTNASAKMSLTDTYKEYPVTLKSMEQDEWDALGLTLNGYIQRDNVACDFNGITDENGVWSVTVKPGLYLVTATKHTIGNNIYSIAPSLIFLPGEDAASGAWNYQVTVWPKTECTLVPPKEQKVTRKVLKIWKDAGNENKRPAEIVIKLLCDGDVYDTVALSSANSWRWTWDNLDNGHEWVVTEDTVSGYTTRVTQNGSTFSVTNTYQSGGTTDTEQPDEPTKLPQTGLLWWPILPLITVGFLCVLIGLIRRRGEHDA